MPIRKKARKWVLNLWTIALTVLSATGLNPFEGIDPVMQKSTIVQNVRAWSEAPAGLDEQCVGPHAGPAAHIVIHRRRAS